MQEACASQDIHLGRSWGLLSKRHVAVPRSGCSRYLDCCGGFQARSSQVQHEALACKRHATHDTITKGVGVSGKVYISGALTGVPNAESVKSDYERIGRLCEERGFQAYVPHLHTDPVAHARFPAKHVYTTDKYHVCSASLVIACVDIPSLGVGQEIEIARECGVPVILVYRCGHHVSRMTRGSPIIAAEVCYHDMEDALRHLSLLLEQFSTRGPEILFK